MSLSSNGILNENKVEVLGASLESIKKAEKRDSFRTAMNSIKEPVVESTAVTSTDEALVFASKVNFPIMIRPAYTRWNWKWHSRD